MSSRTRHIVLKASHHFICHIIRGCLTGTAKAQNAFVHYPCSTSILLPSVVHGNNVLWHDWYVRN